MTTPQTPPPPRQHGQVDPDLASDRPGGAPQQTPYAQMPGLPDYALFPQPTGQPGRMRPTGTTILLVFVTLGIWAFVYYYQVHDEMRRHSGQGLGGVLALVISIVFGVVSPFLLSNEVGQLYDRRGQQSPVSALTGLWFFPGLFILVGPFIWFIRTNNALNEYWRGLGVTETTLV
ncbi:DUF4234 domain-containing protein [Blastococcus sp. VKM Ac-2987]|uniref:DUF4234 domain-containing protein n=1 Tax=Blastococcus sp. VKM Ac-2987 TaxID=3004141 RepID=UPI0022ABAF88|nr:DUF4234 domain-containing protein [Blastococcus sp. VKM Ac-2987]MCZ2860639.1 DUF4234 domain-containing protein [Blastococcus sp. VKM Ac-2987]